MQQFMAEERRAEKPGEGSLEERLERRLRTESLAWAKANPGKALHLAGVKVLRMWNCWPNEARFASWPIRLVVFFHVYPVCSFCDNRSRRTNRPGLAVFSMLAAGRVPYVVACGVRQLDPLPWTGDASIAGAGGGNGHGSGKWEVEETSGIQPLASCPSYSTMEG